MSAKYVRKLLTADDPFWEWEKAERKRLGKELKQRLTRSHVFREGAKLYLRQLAKKLALARKGALHVKQRKPWQ